MDYHEGEVFTSKTALNTEDSEFFGCTFKDLNLSERSLRNSKFIDCKFFNSNLSNIFVTNSTFRDCLFTECKAVGVNWSSSHVLSNLSFFDCNLSYNVFQDLTLGHSKFVNSNLADSDFSGANLIKVELNNTDLSSAIFNNTDLSGADLRNAFNYLIDVNFNKVSKAMFSAPECISLLKSFDIIIK